MYKHMTHVNKSQDTTDGRGRGIAHEYYGSPSYEGHVATYVRYVEESRFYNANASGTR